MTDIDGLGRTQITASEFENQISRDNAVTYLSDNGVPQPEEQLDTFVQQVPALLSWVEQYGREYPWRKTTDPWEVYAAEILLQRTRADAVAGIYDDFFDKFPTPSAITEADEEDIFSAVETLGFGNQRTRSLQEAAQLCVEQHDGEVPADIDELKKPWRVGPYSARACLLFAYHEPVSLVDANIARIIERVFNYEMPQQPHKSDSVYALMDSLTPRDPEITRAFYLALLDLGALICTDEQPNCDRCPLEACCWFASR